MKTKRKGFTIIELTLAMSFLAILLITIAILVVRIVGIYQNGLALRAVNSTGRQIIDDFTRSIASAPITNVTYNPNNSQDKTQAKNITDHNAKATYKYYFQKTDPNNNGVPLAGAFCTGVYTYIWNTAYGLKNNSGFTYVDSKGKTTLTSNLNGKYFRLLKIADSERSICISQRLNSGGVIDPNTSKFTTPATNLDTAPVELLSTAEDELALYDLRVFPASVSRLTGQILYSSTFILATLRGDVDITRSGDYCTADYGTLSTDFSYCAINKFNFAMRATGEAKGSS